MKTKKLLKTLCIALLISASANIALASNPDKFLPTTAPAATSYKLLMMFICNGTIICW